MERESVQMARLRRSARRGAAAAVARRGKAGSWNAGGEAFACKSGKEDLDPRMSIMFGKRRQEMRCPKPGIHSDQRDGSGGGGTVRG